MRRLAQLLTIPKAAALLGVPASTRRRAAKTRHIPSHGVSYARKRVRLAEVVAAIDEARES